jgi:hypothetical protein
MPSSFMSEHTAEYVLVPDLARQLNARFRAVTPIFFWARREGTALARANPGGSVRLIAAYARRPKTEYSGAPDITVKFNELVFEHTWALSQVGVPVFAGVPCVSRLSDLQLNTAVAWFYIEPQPHGWSDWEIKIHLDPPNPVTVGIPPSLLHGPLLTDDLIHTVCSLARPMSWTDALETVGRVGLGHFSAGNYGRRWLGWFLRYKPFYLLLQQ